MIVSPSIRGRIQFFSAIPAIVGEFRICAAPIYTRLSLQTAVALAAVDWKGTAQGIYAENGSDST